MCPLFSLSEVGYRQFGPLPPPDGIDGRTVAGRLAQWDGYEIAEPWVRRLGRRRGTRPPAALELLDVIGRSTPLVGERVRFIDDHYRSSQFADPSHTQYVADSVDTLLATVEDARTSDDRAVGMYRLMLALAYAGRDRLTPLFRDQVAPCFFDLYPEGRIAVVRYHPTVDHAAAAMRIMYALSQNPLTDLANSRRENYAGMQTLQAWHSNSLLTFGAMLLTLSNHLFYPFVAGVRGGPPGLDFVFLFDPAPQHTPRLFPRSWPAFASSAADFGIEETDFPAVMRDVNGPLWQHASHQRVRSERPYAAAQQVELLRWYLSRVNRLLYEMTDLANFTREEGGEAVIDPVFAFEHYLTVDRLARQTLLSMSLEEVGTAKHLVFAVADLYDGLAARHARKKPDADFFKRLFHPRDGLEMVTSRLSTLPAPFGSDLVGLAERCYRRLQETVIESVWLRQKVTGTGVLVRNKDLSGEREWSHADFVGEVMRAYRNAHHGYFTASDPANRPSRYLYMVDGNLPVEMASLPVLWWLSFVADPKFAGWEHLPVDYYEV